MRVCSLIENSVARLAVRNACARSLCNPNWNSAIDGDRLQAIADWRAATNSPRARTHKNCLQELGGLIHRLLKGSANDSRPLLADRRPVCEDCAASSDRVARPTAKKENMMFIFVRRLRAQPRLYCRSCPRLVALGGRRDVHISLW